MSVARVTQTSSEEHFAPPKQEIEVSVIAGDVFITVYEGSLDDLLVGRRRAYEVPVLALNDLQAALGAFSQCQQHLFQTVKP